MFGRAVQFGVRPIVRSSSVISAFAVARRIDHTAIAFGDQESLARTLTSLRKATAL